MTTATENLIAYRDGDRFVVGLASWQDCRSRTYGVADAYSRRELRNVMADWSGKSPTEIESAKRHFTTNERFEDVCDAGEFGAAW